jgi:hypothetical protein
MPPKKKKDLLSLDAQNSDDSNPFKKKKASLSKEIQNSQKLEY